MNHMLSDGIYRKHAQRVLRILNVEDLVEGLVYCDYAQPNFVCKPEFAFYHDVRCIHYFSNIQY